MPCSPPRTPKRVPAPSPKSAHRTSRGADIDRSRNSPVTSHSPVIAGIGQVANKDEDRIVHPVDLLEQAARLALADAGIPAHRVGGVLATPLSTYSTDDASELLAARLDLPPGLRAVTGYTGAGPQQLMAQACRAIIDGTVEAVLIVGGIADASVRRARRLGLQPPAPPTSRWSQGAGAPVLRDVREARHHKYHPNIPEIASGGGMPSAYFALVESSLSPGLAPEQHRESLGRLMAPFTEVAARRPHLAWFPTPREAYEIATPTAENRLVAEPYTKLMCSFPTVDLAAALVITKATDSGPLAVRPLALVRGREAGPPSGRPVYHRPEMLHRMVETAERLSGVEVADIAQFDLYSCFPAAVKVISAALGLGPGDERPRTASGGLPYFGGPGASYSLHGLACLVEDLRARPDTIGAAVSLGGMMNDFSLGFYGVGEGDCAIADLGESQELQLSTASSATGPAVVDAATVLHDKDRGPVAAPVIARLPDGTRIGARAADPGLPAALAGGPSLVGRDIELTTSEAGFVTYQLR
jgi:acetyl-CoA C-acetyltransferase